jgi:hypothetical protein
MKLRLYFMVLLLLGSFSLPAKSNLRRGRFEKFNPKHTNRCLPFLVTPDSAFFHKAETLKDSLAGLQKLPKSYLNKVQAKTDLLNARLTRRTSKALRRLKKQEEKINSRLSKIDSVAAHNLFATSLDSMSHLQDMVRGKITKISSRIPGGQYISRLDTLQASLKFLDKYKSELGQVKGLQQKLQESLGSVHQLEGKLGQVQDIQQYIQQRKQLLTKALSGYGQLFSKNLGKINQEVFYLHAQVQNYKQLWEHPDQAEARALSLLRRTPAFSDFMKKNSMIASLFHLPSDYGSTASLQGLQTRSMVERELQQRLQQAGADGRQKIQQQMAQAKQQLQQLKDKLPGGGSSAQMPDFQPKDMKSKTLRQRLELGANVQFNKASSLFPTTSDIAGQVAYKFSKKGSAGLGMSFNLGWGTNIRKIHFTAQGLGLRSFMSMKVKGKLYLNGGFEFDHDKTIPNIPALKDMNGWTRSALLGIERKYKISNKVKGDVMLLFDFLYQEKGTAPLVFRTGYTF